MKFQHSKDWYTEYLRVLLFLTLLCCNLFNIVQSQKDSEHLQAGSLVGYVQQLKDNYIVEVYTPPENLLGGLNGFVHGLVSGSEEPFMVADLTGERLCFAQASKLTCIERLDSGQVENRHYLTPSTRRIVSINFPHPRTNDYEVIYTTKGKSTISVMMFDSKSNSSFTIYKGDNIYEENIAVDTNNWFLFFEDVNHEIIWHVDLIEETNAEKIPNKMKKTTDGTHRINTIAVDIRSGVLYNMMPNSVSSWFYLNETVARPKFPLHGKEYKSHLSLSTSGTLTYVSHHSDGNSSLESQIMNPKERWATYYPKQVGTMLFGTEISWIQNKTNLDACPRFCRMNGTGNCICWCPNDKPLQTVDKDCKPLVVLAVEESGAKVLTTTAEPTEEWNWLKTLQYGQEVVAYNSLKDRLCEPKLNPEFNGTGIRCYAQSNLDGFWVPNANHISQNPKNAPYLVNQAANTSDLYWMAEDVNETQSLWALENGIAKNMEVYLKWPQHVAVDSFRQILFWCTKSEGKVQLRWQAFNRNGTKPNCYEREVSAATECNGLAISEVQSKVYILSQYAVHQATYKELQQEGGIQISILKFSRKGPRKSMSGFSYHSGNLIWFSPSGDPSTVNIFRLNDVNKSVKSNPVGVIGINRSISQIQVLVPHYETLESTDPCHGFTVNFADICTLDVPQGVNPPEKCTVDSDPPVETTTPLSIPTTEKMSSAGISLVTSTSTTVLNNTQKAWSPTPTSQLPFVEIAAPPETGATPKSSEEQGNSDWWPYLAGGAGGATLIAFIIILNILACRRLKRHNDFQAQQAAVNTFVSGNEALARKSTTEAQRALHLPFRSIIPPNSLQTSETVLGEGNFGIVCTGKFDGREVAVKTMKNNQDNNVIQDFLKELKIMAYVGLHQNIVEFFGAEISQARHGIVHVVLELCSQGSLESYVRKFHVVETGLSPTTEYEKTEPDSSRSSTSGEKSEITLVPNRASYQNVTALTPTPTPSTSVSLNQLMKWARQIASGMNYLEQKNVVHGDLATRNVLVCEDLTVKISDFGFSKNMYQSDTYRKRKACPLPWRWASPETLSRFEFSFKADVWSYGVTVWEIFTLGAVPFPDKSWNKDFVDELKMGMRLPLPEHLPESVFESTLLPCWNYVPGDRPSFQQLEDCWLAG